MISLLPYQVESAANLLRSLRENRVAVSASDTGTGKTYEAAWIVDQLMPAPVTVVCPKAVIPVWKRVLEEAGVLYPSIVNYEKLRAGNTIFGKFEVKKWTWGNIAPETIFVFDEVHRCKSPTSQNARILAAAKPYRCLLLSATLAQDPTEMRALGYLLGLHSWLNFYKWCLRNGCWKGRFGGIEFKKKTAATHLLALHEQIFPRFGSRIRIVDLGDAFPDNHVSAEVYSFGNEAQVNAAYDEAAEEKNRRILADEPVNGGALLIQARQKAEVLKADGLASMAADLIAEGNSVVIFTCFRETLAKLCAKLKCPGIFGGQSQVDRQRAIDDFQTDKARAIAVNIQAGGVGIGLHQVQSDYPRVSLICPTDSAVDLKQALGRIHRQGSKSKAVQKLVFAAGTYEEKVCKRVQGKLANISLLQDGDLDPLAELAPDGRITNEVLEKARVAIMKSAAPTVMVNGEPHWVIDPNAADYSTLSNDIHQNETIPCEVSATCESSAVIAVPETTTERKHAPLSPSKLKAKAICPGYESDDTGDRKFSDRGVLAHKAVETNDVSLVGQDAQLKNAVEKCISLKRRITAGMRVEQEVKLYYAGSQWGFADLVAFSPDGKSAVLADYKFSVHPHFAESPQFHSYGWALWDKNPILETISVYVPVPFRDEVDCAVWSRTNDYERIVGSVVAIIERAHANRPEDYTVSSQCQYCAARGTCVALARQGLEIARKYSPDLNLPDIDFHGSNIADPAHFEVLLQVKPALESACEGWSRAALAMHDSGVEVPGTEIVTRAGRRNVVSARGAFDLLRKEVAPEITPEDFIEACSITSTALTDLVKAAAKPRQKTKTVELFNALLTDADLLDHGSGGRFIRPLRK